MTALRQFVALALYALLLRLATPLYLLRLWRRGRREPLYRHALAERLGFYRGEPPAPGAVWLHAVSLGETRAAKPLVDQLRRQRPGLRLLFTHGTATGREAGQALLAPGDLQAWFPYDTPGAARRFLRRFRPAAGVLMETELWPAMMREARRARVPIVLANARLSQRSARKGERLAALMRPAAASLNSALTQTADDAQRLRAAGVRDVVVCGNLKFDLTPPAELLDRGVEWRRTLPRPVVLAASSREGEEVELLALWREVPQPRPLLLVVPRHPQRFDEVGALIRAEGFTLARRSQWNEVPPQAAAEADVWLGDSLGEMPVYYACADVALLGGSFAELGGQNLIEAAACGCPVVMGPHTFNFAQAAAKSLGARASVRVRDLREGVLAALKLAADSDRKAWVERALDFALAHRGAARDMAERVLRLVPAAADDERTPGAGAPSSVADAKASPATPQSAASALDADDSPAA